MSRKMDNPLLSQLNAAGAVIEERHDRVGTRSRDVALHFGDELAERQALTQSAGLVDLSGRGLLVVSGADRVDWLHGLCTQDIKGLSHGQSAYACHVNIKGRIIADMHVGVWEDLFLIDVDPGVAPGLRRALKKYVVMEDVRVVDRSNVSGTLGVIGPEAAAVMSASGIDVSALAPDHLNVFDVRGVEALVATTEQFGVPGFRVTVARQDLSELWETLTKADGQASAPRLCGSLALETTRVATGVPRFGVELDESVLFNEAELTTAVSFSKGCYLGQEVVERVDARGNVARRLLGLTLKGVDGPESLPPVGSEVRNAKRKLGLLTSVAWLEELPGAVAMGFVHRADNEPGTTLEVHAPTNDEGGPWEGIVVERGQWLSTAGAGSS